MLSFRLEYPSGYHSSASLFRSGLTSPLHLSYMCGHMCFRMFHSSVIRCPATAPVPLNGNILDAPPVRARDERGPGDFLRSYHVLPTARAVACAPALALLLLLVRGLFPLPLSLLLLALRLLLVLLFLFCLLLLWVLLGLLLPHLPKLLLSLAASVADQDTASVTPSLLPAPHPGALSVVAPLCLAPVTALPAAPLPRLLWPVDPHVEVFASGWCCLSSCFGCRLCFCSLVCSCSCSSCPHASAGRTTCHFFTSRMLR